MFTLVWTPALTRSAGRVIQRHPEQRERLLTILRDLESNPFQPRLRYHPLGGKLQGFQEVTYEFRIILSIEVTEQEIILLDVGSHDDGYRQGDRPGPGT